MIVGIYEDVQGTSWCSRPTRTSTSSRSAWATELAGERIVCKWVRLTSIQAVEIAEAILGRWGDDRP